MSRFVVSEASHAAPWMRLPQPAAAPSIPWVRRFPHICGGIAGREAKPAGAALRAHCVLP